MFIKFLVRKEQKNLLNKIVKMYWMICVYDIIKMSYMNKHKYPFNIKYNGINVCTELEKSAIVYMGFRFQAV